MIRNIATWISLAVALICVAMMNNFYYPLWLVSINYAIFMLLWARKKDNFNAPGINIIYWGMFARYALLPLSYYIFGGYHLYTPTYFPEAIAIMLFEQIVVFYYILKTTNNKINFDNGLPSNNLSKSKLFFITTVSIFGLLISYSSTTLDVGYAIISNSELSEFFKVEVEDKSLTTSALMVIWTISMLLLYVCLVLLLKNHYSKNNNIIFVYITLFFTLLLAFLTFINQSGAGMARWQTIVYTLSGMFLIMKLFKKKRNLIFKTIFIPLGIAILFVTAVKNGGMSERGPSFYDAMEHTFGPESMDAYLNGPDGISGSIKLKKESDLDITSLFHDIIHPIPIVHKFEDVNLETNLRYNRMVGKLGFIIPLTGQSIIYFGYLFAPILSILIIYLVRYFDKRYLAASNFMVYFFAFCSIWFALAITFTDFTILSAWFFSPILPFYIILLLFNKKEHVSLKRKAMAI